MPSIVQTILRNATRKQGESINILSFPTHERYQSNLSKSGHNFYLWQGDGIKPWVSDYAKVPPGTILLNPENGSNQKCRGYRKKILASNVSDEVAGHTATNKRADTTASRNQAKQTTALFASVDVGHEAPENRDNEQIEHAYPNKECSRQPYIALLFFNCG